MKRKTFVITAISPDSCIEEVHTFDWNGGVISTELRQCFRELMAKYTDEENEFDEQTLDDALTAGGHEGDMGVDIMLNVSVLEA